MSTLVRSVLTATFSVLLLAGGSLVAGTPSATAAPPSADVVTFTIPATGGVEVGPASVPGGSFRPVTVVARPAPRTLQYPPPPSAVEFTVPRPAPYHYQYSYRYLSVSWLNLQTGKRGTVQLRHWQLPGFAVAGYPASLPTSAVAQTGAGAIVATVTVLREEWKAPPRTISVIPGLTAIAVP
ncbi:MULTISPECIES: hypothetical protein [unclassified Gordonia (in: high G+C Gram-positive bacteria)]